MVDVSTIGFVHTVLSLPPTFAALAEELVPDADVFHIADETLLGVTRREGRLTPATRRRVLGYVGRAGGGGGRRLRRRAGAPHRRADGGRGGSPRLAHRRPRDALDDARAHCRSRRAPRRCGGEGRARRRAALRGRVRQRPPR